MSKAAAIRKGKNSRSEVLYVALELGLKQWKVVFAADWIQGTRTRDIPARDRSRFLREIRDAAKHFDMPSGVAVVSCYEAGRDGFWIHRWLESEGVTNCVVDPASVEINRRGRAVKSDRLDAVKLLTMLMRYQAGEPGVWKTVRVPSGEDEDARQLERWRRTLHQERTAGINRIKALLIAQGIWIESVPKDLESFLERATLWNGERLPSGLQSRLREEHRRWALAEEQLLSVERTQKRELRDSEGAHLEQIRGLMQIRGIGVHSAWTFVTELFRWRDLRNRRQVGALTGFTPVAHQSGELDRDRSISRAGNRYVRAIAVDLAWMWLRLQPDSALTLWYQRRFGAGGPRMRKIGIVALARKLVIALWRYLQLGVVPEGATLKG